jgi:3'(2'),5'-bisphosphate nucleotidase
MGREKVRSHRLSTARHIRYEGAVSETAAAMRIDRAFLAELANLARAAGEAILDVQAAGFAVSFKSDQTPVTEADRRAEEIILAGLARLAPEIPVVAEEQVAAGRMPERPGNAFFLVDALDGTKDFVRGGPDFTVNIALAIRGEAAAGIVLQPATGRLWIGAPGVGAFAGGRPEEIEPIRVRTPEAGALGIIASRTHRNPATDAFIARFPGSEIVSAGSSLKFAIVAEGGADLYPRLAPTSQWDTAAGDAVLRAAGGRVLTLDGAPLPYGALSGKAGAAAFLNPSFVATGGLDPFA